MTLKFSINMFQILTMLLGSTFYLANCDDRPEIDVNLEGKTAGTDDVTWLQLTCFSHTYIQGCSSEFLINNKSLEQIRGEGMLCYHSGGMCYEQLCTCVNDCQQFTLNITLFADISNTTFGCKLKLEVHEITYKATIQIKMVENVFIKISKEIIPIHGHGSVQDMSTHSPNKENTIATYGIVIIIGIGIIVFVCMIIVVIRKVKVCKLKQKSNNKAVKIGQNTNPHNSGKTQLIKTVSNTSNDEENLAGHTSSNSSGTEEGKQTVSNTYKISLNNKIVLPGHGSEESSV